MSQNLADIYLYLWLYSENARFWATVSPSCHSERLHLSNLCPPECRTKGDGVPHIGNYGGIPPQRLKAVSGVGQSSQVNK